VTRNFLGKRRMPGWPMKSSSATTPPRRPEPMRSGVVTIKPLLAVRTQNRYRPRMLSGWIRTLTYLSFTHSETGGESRAERSHIKFYRRS
jgi:hypothetical protein